MKGHVKVPKRMRTLPRDARNYPIPFIVFIDKTGQPQFTINDSALVKECIRKKLCSICGKRLNGNYWFVGGSRCFLHARGSFLDPPLHLECAEFALRVCPFLAASHYYKRIDDAKLAPDAIPDGMALYREVGMKPYLPERFGLGCTHGYKTIDQILPLIMVDRWEHIEFWHAGEPVNAPDSKTVEELCQTKPP
jgi:hypothetical protein